MARRQARAHLQSPVLKVERAVSLRMTSSGTLAVVA
jgi:hypothetical protein